LRITTNHEIYWDRCALAFIETPPSVTRHALGLRAADVAEVGFAQRTTLTQQRPHYDYQRRRPLWDTRHPKGFYSDWGSALDLVAQTDDAVAVIGPGEEVHLEFATLPDPPASVRRWFVLELNGWCKDMDLYTQHGDTVEPLPVRDGGTSDQEAERRAERHRQNHRRLRMGY
jgi:hypothetical protein